MTLEEAQLYITRNHSLIGKELECGFICGALWILPVEQPGLDNCIKHYISTHSTEVMAMPMDYDGEVGVIAVDIRYLNGQAAFIYKILAE